VDINTELVKKHGSQAQLLLTIRKIRNRYNLETPTILKMKDMPEEKKNEIRDQDVDNMYGENGEHLVPSSEMNEQMYLVVRSIMHHN